MMTNLSIAIEEKFTEQKDAAIAMGMDQGNLSTFIKDRVPSKIRGVSKRRIADAFPEYNLDWLLERSSIKLKSDLERFSKIHPSPTGDGIQLPDGRIIGKVNKQGDTLPSVNHDKIGAPYYDVDFIGGFDLVFNNQIAPSYYIDFAPFNDVDAWVNITGHSMYPLISNNDIVGLQKVENWETFILEGEIYAIITNNGFRTVKTLGRGTSKDEFMLIPYNKSDEYQPQPIPKSIITHVFKVKGAIKKFF